MEPYWDLIRRIVTESDLVLEILDARLIELSRNFRVEEIIKEVDRPMIFVINKSDLVSKNYLNEAVKDLKKKGEVVFVSAKSPKDVKVLLYAIKNVFKKFGKREQTVRQFGDPKVRTREARGDIVVGILGYPNVGKSSIINALAHKKKVKVSKKAGTTHGVHWVKVTNEIKLIDSPGVIPLGKRVEKVDDEIRYGLIGAKTDKMKNHDIVANAIIKLFLKKDVKEFEKFYSINLSEATIDNFDVDSVVELIGMKKNYLVKGGKIDEERVYSEIVRDWQGGKLRF